MKCVPRLIVETSATTAQVNAPVAIAQTADLIALVVTAPVVDSIAPDVLTNAPAETVPDAPPRGPIAPLTVARTRNR